MQRYRYHQDRSRNLQGFSIPFKANLPREITLVMQNYSRQELFSTRLEIGIGRYTAPKLNVVALCQLTDTNS